MPVSFRAPLWLRILISLALGVAAGVLLGERAVVLKPFGELFLRLMRMLVTPVVFVMVVSAIVSTGDLRRLGAIGVRTALWFLIMMALAVTLGLGLGLIMRPGGAVHLGGAAPLPPPAESTLSEQWLAIVPLNPVDALARGDLPPIMLFAALLGIGAVAAGESGRPIATLFQSAMEVLIKMIGLILQTAPLGVFALTAWTVGAHGFLLFGAMLKLGLAVLIGALIQVLLVHVGLAGLGGLAPLRFLRGIASPMLLGFATTSSSATLPASLTAAEINLGLGERIAPIVLPLGVVIGKSGAAMFMGLMVVFAVQALGVSVSPAQYGLLGAAALAMAMSTPSIPSGTLFILPAVLHIAGIPDVQAGLVVAMVLPFDRPMDMIRSVPNVTGGLAVAALVAKAEPR